MAEGTRRLAEPFLLADNVVSACTCRLWRAVSAQIMAQAPPRAEVKSRIAGKTLYDLPPETQKALREEILAILEMAVAGLAVVPVGRFPDVQAWLAQERGRAAEHQK